MSPAEESVAQLRRLLRDVASGVGAAQKQCANVEDAVRAGESAKEALVMAVALHHYYCAVEGVLERLIRFMDGALPAGGDWHKALLREASQDLPGVRGALIPAALLPALSELANFRHFFRHAYDVDLDWQQLLHNAQRVALVHPVLMAALGKVQTTLEQALVRLLDPAV